MKTESLAAAVIVFCGVINNVASASERFESVESADLGDVASLNIDVSHAHVSLVPGESDNLQATLIQTLNSGDKDQCLMTMALQQRGDSLHLQTHKPKVSWNARCDITREIVVALDQTSLEKLNLNLHHGDFTAEVLTVPDQSLSIEHGHSKVTKIQGSNTAVTMSHGGATIDLINSQQVTLRGSHTDMIVRQVTSAQLNGHWSHGDLRFGSVAATSIKLKQSHGAIEFAEHRGEQMDLQNAHGAIRVQASNTATVQLHNSHGSIYYAGSSDLLQVKNSHGGVELVQHNNNFRSIESKATHGHMSVKVPEASVCNFKAPQVKKLNGAIMKSGADCDIATGGDLNLYGAHSHATISAL